MGELQRVTMLSRDLGGFKAMVKRLAPELEGHIGRQPARYFGVDSGWVVSGGSGPR
jgi:hypothetical protein